MSQASANRHKGTSRANGALGRIASTSSQFAELQRQAEIAAQPTEAVPRRRSIPASQPEPNLTYDSEEEPRPGTLRKRYFLCLGGPASYFPILCPFLFVFINLTFTYWNPRFRICRCVITAPC